MSSRAERVRALRRRTATAAVALFVGAWAVIGGPALVAAATKAPATAVVQPAATPATPSSDAVPAGGDATSVPDPSASVDQGTTAAPLTTSQS
jgi:hypothetical protein